MMSPGHKDSYPLPRIDESIETLSGAKRFSTLDLRSGYWQVELDPQDKEKTAFSLGSGLWQFTVMPFGLANAPATFERLIGTGVDRTSTNHRSHLSRRCSGGREEFIGSIITSSHCVAEVQECRPEAST